MPKNLLTKSVASVRTVFTDRAATEVGKDMAGGTQAGSQVVVYYADDAGQIVVHFFQEDAVSES